MQQLRKEQEEERQLAELQRLQEQSTGKKRVEKLDWMYAAPSNEGGALGGAKISETMMEDYLLGKRRVDDVLAAGEKNVSLDKWQQSNVGKRADWCRLDMRIKSLSLCKMPIQLVIPPPKFAKIHC